MYHVVHTNFWYKVDVPVLGNKYSFVRQKLIITTLSGEHLGILGFINSVSGGFCVVEPNRHHDKQQPTSRSNVGKSLE